MSLFTQWVPSSWSEEPHREELEYAYDRGSRATPSGPQPGPVRDPSPGDRPVRHGAHLRPDRREHLPRRAVRRPAVPQPARGRLRGLPLAYRRPLPGALRNPWRRRRVRHPGLAGGEGGAGRPTPPPSLAAQRDWPPTLAAHHQPHDAGLPPIPRRAEMTRTPAPLPLEEPRPASARSAIRGCSPRRTPIPTCWRGSRSTSSMGAGSAPVARPTSRATIPAGRTHRYDRGAADP